MLLRFHDIAWGRLHDDYPRGIIAGALENGSLDLWDAEKLLDGSRLAAFKALYGYKSHQIVVAMHICRGHRNTAGPLKQFNSTPSDRNYWRALEQKARYRDEHRSVASFREAHRYIALHFRPKQRLESIQIRQHGRASR